MASWDDIVELNWSKNGRLMVRIEGGTFENVWNFLETVDEQIRHTPVNLKGCPVGPTPTPIDAECTSINVKLDGGEVKGLAALFGRGSG